MTLLFARRPFGGALLALLVAVAAMSPCRRVHAETTPAMSPSPQGVVHLNASATVEVTKDLMSVVLNTTREGQDAATVQTQLKQALDLALVEARKVASPGRLELRAGNFTVSPRYSNKGAVNGWQGSTELIVEGRDLQAIGQLTAKITTLTIARVGYDVSRELREKTEAEVSAQAIARYRSRAADYAKQFGYASFAIREVEVATSDGAPDRPRPMMAMKAAAPMSSEEPLATEPGKANVTVSVGGSVQLVR